MNITIEMAGVFLTLIGMLFGGFWALMSKLDKIRSELSKMQKDYVEHEVCQARRDRCPCVNDIRRIENTIEKQTNKQRGEKMKGTTLVTGLMVVVICAAFLLAGCGCSTIDFRKKALAAEIKVYGLDAEITSTTSEESIAKVRLGVVTTRYISVPKGGKGKIKMDYDGWNFWTLSGSAKSEMEVENDASESTTTDSPTKE